MPLAPAITDIEQLKDRPFVADLLAWRADAVEVAYHLLSMKRKERIRLKVRLSGDEPSLESIVSVWPSVNFFEREIFDLFGIRFMGHPYLRRIMMPEDWEGHPLRRDYPVEGYR